MKLLRNLFTLLLGSPAASRPAPAVMTLKPSGDKDCQFHREDGPAIQYANGDKAWYQNGLLHRDDGPALEYANGDTYWYREGRLHREDGPAVEVHDFQAWYLRGQLLTEREIVVLQECAKERSLRER